MILKDGFGNPINFYNDDKLKNARWWQKIYACLSESYKRQFIEYKPLEI